jgi:hypothetical protein
LSEGAGCVAISIKSEPDPCDILTTENLGVRCILCRVIADDDAPPPPPPPLPPLLLPEKPPQMHMCQSRFKYAQKQQKSEGAFRRGRRSRPFS